MGENEYVRSLKFSEALDAYLLLKQGGPLDLGGAVDVQHYRLCEALRARMDELVPVK